MSHQDVITTESSNAEGRLKVGAGCLHGKKKCLKCAISVGKKDGKGGPGYGLKPSFKALKGITKLKKMKKTKVKSIISPYKKLRKSNF